MNNNNLLLNIKKSIKEILTDSSLPIKSLFLASSILYPISILFPSICFNYFTIKPAIILPPKFWFWTLLTYPFFENNLLALIFGLFMITVASKLLEPLWGYKEFFKFILISSITSGFFSGIIYLIVYCLTLNEIFLYSKKFYGLAAIIGSICIGLKQTRGEDFILKTPWLSLQINDVPFIILTSFWSLSIILNLFTLEYCTLLTTGMYCSWIYLRFYQNHQRGQGDMADHFSLDKFFPRPLNRFIKVGSFFCWQLSTRFGLCKKSLSSSTLNNQLSGQHNLNNINNNSSSSNNTPANMVLPGVDNFDAERRRQKALQQLNERLQKTEEIDKNVDNFEEETEQNKNDKNSTLSDVIVQ